ncbi:MAG: patatin-like phospholipase family protein [Alphaproteobacteria bacterium]|nr:patatin-like phospholipase family protein [Alphaproteobacteria bacterium]
MAVAFILAGCSTVPWNQSISPAAASQAGPATPKTRSSDKVFVVLAFSGGGTRSAAFSYGVLEALRDTTVTIGGNSRRLLDEVDVITSVSGGSYTAAYYGLFGERTFSDFEWRFLKRDVQGELTSLLVNPLALASLATPAVNRSDLAATWLGENIFENKTIGDMNGHGGPMVIVNASDLNTGSTFSFVSRQFDFLCSKVEDYPVARAVMASSAVPGYFAAVSVRNAPEDCAARRRPWVQAALEKRDIYSRDYQVARALQRYLDPEHMPFVQLIDGGVTDNLGVRGSILSPILHDGNVEDMRGAFSDGELDGVRNVLVIVANSQIYEDYRWSREGQEPGLVQTLSASFDSAIGIMNTETIGLARQGFMNWADRVNRRPSRAGEAPVKLHFAALTLDHIDDEQERSYFNSIPTTLSLPSHQIDEIRALSRRLLDDSPEYNSFLQELR